MSRPSLRDIRLTHWLIVLAIVLLIFGTKKLRNLGGDLGAAIKNFKGAMKEGEQESLQKPDVPAVQSTGIKAGWGIQVGAFSDDAPARKAAKKAASKLRKKIRMKAQILVVPVQQGAETIYRAQLVGLSRNTANEACRRLQSRKVNCVPVPPSD